MPILSNLNNDTQYEWDVFISHASEDKDAFVRPLAEGLLARGFNVWYDDFTLRLGDDIRKSIDEGLLQSHFCVVVLSSSYFSKTWPQEEFQNALERQREAHQRFMLPILHGIGEDEVKQKSLSLSRLKSISSEQGLETVIASVAEAIDLERSTVPKEFDLSKLSGESADVSPSMRELMPTRARIDEFRAPSSHVGTLFDLIGREITGGFATVDLGEGNSWLSSRLFIFSLILRRMCDLRQFVFVETEGNVEGKFIGTGSPEDIRWILAKEYPWLEGAFAIAYSRLVAVGNGGVNIVSASGELELHDADQLIMEFVREIQRDVAPESDEGQWTTLGHRNLWEHATWLNGGDVRRVLGKQMNTAILVENPELAFAEQKRRLLQEKGQFVAIVDEEKRFTRLVDQHALLDSSTHSEYLRP